MKTIRLAIAAAVLALSPLLLCAQVESANKACTHKFHQHSVTVDGYLFRTYKEITLKDEFACLEVVHAGKVVFRKVEEGGEFSLGQKSQPEYKVPAVKPGSDLTGRGHPNMIASYYSGGAHCCTSILLFELEPQLKLLSTLETGNSDIAHFERNPQDGRYEFVTWDDLFAYWHACFTCSPMPKLILSPASDKKGSLTFQLDLAKMRMRAPTEQEWSDKYLPQARAAFAPKAAFDDYYAGAELWSPMLDWIYGGQAEWAWKLVDTAWPAEKPGKSEFLNEFCGQLTKSQYWTDLQPQIGNPPKACMEGIAEAQREENAHDRD